MVDYIFGNPGYRVLNSASEYVSRVTIDAGATINTTPILVAKGLSAGTSISSFRILTTVALAGVTKFKLALHRQDIDRQVGTSIIPNLAVADIAVPTATTEAKAFFGGNTLVPIGTLVGDGAIGTGFDLFLFGDAASTNEATLIIHLTTIVCSEIRFSLGGKTTVTENVTPAT